MNGEPPPFRIACSTMVRDSGGRILVVREADSRVRGKINLPDAALLRSKKMRQIVSDVLVGAAHPISLLRELDSETWEQAGRAIPSQ